MSGKDEYDKAVFRRAAARAFRLWAMEPWELEPSEGESWTVCAVMRSGDLQRGIQLKLRKEQHWTEAVVFVSKAAALVQSLPWWEDRRNASNAPGYRSVIWEDACRYAQETRLCVPKGASEDDLARMLTEFLGEIHNMASTWFAQAEAVLTGSGDDRDDAHQEWNNRRFGERSD